MKWLFVFLLIPTIAHAQQASPETQALQARVMSEINANLQCSTAAITMQQEIVKLKAELEEARKK